MLTPPNARRERAQIPANLGLKKDDAGLVAWDWVDGQISKARSYWVCSMRADGQPQARPLWGVYLDSALYFDGMFRSRWFRNLQHNPLVTVHLENADDAVIIEGHVEVTEGAELAQRIADAYAVKYAPYAPEPDPGGFVLRPKVIFAWHNADVAKTATRWIFE